MSGLFTCEGERCVQARTRVPDAAEWDCAALHGASVCLRSVEAAGIAPGMRDPGFRCGARKRHPAQEVCVDFAPDVPDQECAWHCRMGRALGRAERVCEAARGVQLGAACIDDCPDGARCVNGVCVPPRPHPDCWLDEDCAPGERCRWGSCGT